MRHVARGLILWGALCGPAACAPASSDPTGDLPFGDDAAASDGGPADGSTGALPAPAPMGVALFAAACNAASAPAVDWSPMRRISRVEYDNMVRDLLDDNTHPARDFPPESPLASGVNFQDNTYQGVSTLIVQDYAQAAETLAQNAVSSPTTLARILPCQTQDQACATQFIESWANLAFRGQLDATAEASLMQLYADTAAQFDFATGIQAVIMAVLESPRFLYVLEAGGPAASVVPLTPYELAARLALFLWRSVPDATLMQAAHDGQLATAAQVQAQATRMLADPKARDALDDFATQWMQLQATPALGKDTQYSFWNGDPKLGAEMADETRTNVEQTVLGGGTLTDLLTSPSSYINGDLARFYGNGRGNSSVSLGSGPSVTVNDGTISDTLFVKTAIPHRAGVLTNAGVLATQAHTSLPSSVLRGKLVREQVLCDAISPPPPGIPAPASSVPDGGTTRSVLEAHFDHPPCSTCHQAMDPIGLGFGFFDATGAYQPDDANGATSVPNGGFPAIDATGEVKPQAPGELSASFDGAADLATQLAGAAQTQQCFALQTMRYALSRVETAADACSARAVLDAFSSSQLGLQSLLVAIAGSDAFRNRAAPAPGGACK
jgi:hypothetical protein